MRLTEEQYQEIVARRKNLIGAIEQTEQKYEEYKKRAQFIPQHLFSDLKINRTEERFAAEILVPLGFAWAYNAVNLRLDYRKHYRPDFVAWKNGETYVFEVKGPHIRDDARTNFLWARKEFPGWRFEAWQWKDKTWKEIWVNRE